MADFGEIYAKHFTFVYRFALALCMDKSFAEEITQETFFKALKSIGKFNGSCRLEVWLCQIARNTFLTLVKKKRKFCKLEEDMPSSLNLESDVLDKEESKRIHVALHELGEPFKEVFTLRIFGELPYAQIGELFGKTDSWARVVYYRAKKMLQEAIK
ncbi:MAG: sigma-70 family RNA polymerase sigma factor [Clostridiales bacterium]|nr:sigma-70 family RNA polymerase sigma factor [Clostridiales bacterium]